MLSRLISTAVLLGLSAQAAIKVPLVHVESDFSLEERVNAYAEDVLNNSENGGRALGYETLDNFMNAQYYGQISRTSIVVRTRVTARPRILVR